MTQRTNLVYWLLCFSVIMGNANLLTVDFGHDVRSNEPRIRLATSDSMVQGTGSWEFAQLCTLSKSTRLQVLFCAHFVWAGSTGIWELNEIGKQMESSAFSTTVQIPCTSTGHIDNSILFVTSSSVYGST